MLELGAGKAAKDGRDMVGPLQLSDETLARLTFRARCHGSRIALICGDEKLSFEELDDRVSCFAAVLEQRGLRPLQVLSLYGPVGLEWVIGYHAALRVGATVNPINALLTPDEVGFILRDCGAAVVLADRKRLETLADEGTLPTYVKTIEFEEIQNLSTREFRLEPFQTDPLELSTICYTSGTTGRPKGALQSHRSVLLNAGLTALMQGRTQDDVIVSALPLAHVYGNVIMNSTLIVGATLVLQPKFSAEIVFDAIEEHQATRFDGVPTMYYRMLESPALSTRNLTSLRMCTVGGQTMAVEKMRAVEEEFDCPLIELWGMSEIAGLGTTFPWTGPHTLGSIGLAMPGIGLRTVEPDSRLVTATNQPGELQIRGPIVMDGYLGNDAATQAVLDEDGWLSTGDFARIDSSGQVFILDRIKDLILTSGNNVYPAEIERVILSLPGVVMVGVGREPHPDKGEIPHAYVVKEPKSPLTAHDIIEHCRSLLARYKLPRNVTFVDELPTTSSGKIMRRALGQGKA
jgi:long-chain acyl-CoA synthetase